MRVLNSALITKQVVSQLLSFKPRAASYWHISIVQQAVAQLVRGLNMVIGQQLVAQKDVV